ncbi:MAG: LemA family protein [Verrucomicrobiales bacterium]|nr:LemA family protein [Verrucomicrobiales bacterium]
MVYAIFALIALPMLAVVIGFAFYNRLIALRNAYKNAFAQIDVQLKRRHDLIPNIVETAKGYIQHERGTLEVVTAARGAAINAAQAAAAAPGETAVMTQLSNAESNLTGALGRLIAIAEAYPDLKANQVMLQLMEELTTTENRVGLARQAYNDSVMFYNTAIQKVPANIVANWYHFTPAEFFQLDNSTDRQLPPVSFS